MKKSLVIASILLLGVAMSARPLSLTSKDREEILKKAKEIHLPMAKRVKRESTCTAISCVAPEGECSPESSYCQAETSCLDGVCRMNTLGDSCNAEGECTGHVTCDASTDECVRRVGLGEDCSLLGCQIGLQCSGNVCIEAPSKIGDACTKSFGESTCPFGMLCSGNSVCVANSRRVGETCDPSAGCGMRLYCDNVTFTCKEFPKVDETCVDSKCYGGVYSELYCDGSNTCKVLKTVGESCSDVDLCDPIYYECGSEGVCKKYDEGVTCSSNKDCGKGQSCVNGVCIGMFTLDEGAECPYVDDDSLLERFTDMFLCKEGLGCVPDRETESGYVCKKIETKFSDEKPCETDADCPADSSCMCNSASGEMQCYPYMTSNKENYVLYSEYLLELIKSVFGGGPNERMYELIFEVGKLTDPYNEEIRCYVNYTYVPPPLPPEPSPSYSSSSSSSSSEHTPIPPKPSRPSSSSSSSSSSSENTPIPPKPSRPSSSSSSSSSSKRSGDDDGGSFAGETFVMPMVCLVAIFMMFF